MSHPPTMLRPRPTFPLQISMVVSLPDTTGQLTGSEAVGVDPSQSDPPLGEVCGDLSDEQEVEETGSVWEEMGEIDEERDVGRGRVKEEDRLLERLVESLTVT